MRIRLVGVIACVLSLGACKSSTPQQQTPSENSASQVPSPPEPQAISDGAVGLDSMGTRYEMRPAVGSEGVEAAMQGSGELAMKESTDVETSSLRALVPLDAGFGIESIIGTDDRVKLPQTTTFPERAQVLIALPGGRCSGVMVGKDLVLTAGHCVYSDTWMTSATVYPGRNGNQSPFGSCNARKFYSVLGWTRDKNPAYDFGAIKLNCDIGTRVGWLGFFWQTASLMGKQARISSYPGDKPLEQWTHTDAVRWESALQTGYATDTQPGNSGSGVFASSGVPEGCNGPCVYTVHAYGGSTRNSGTRITQPLFDNIVRWKAE